MPTFPAGGTTWTSMFRNYMPGTYPLCWQSGSTWYSSTFGSCTGNLIPLYLLFVLALFRTSSVTYGASQVFKTVMRVAASRF